MQIPARSIGGPLPTLHLSNLVEQAGRLAALHEFRQSGQAFLRKVVLLNDGPARRRSQMLEAAGVREGIDDAIGQFFNIEERHEDAVTLIDDVTQRSGIGADHKAACAYGFEQ